MQDPPDDVLTVIVPKCIGAFSTSEIDLIIFAPTVVFSVFVCAETETQKTIIIATAADMMMVFFIVFLF